MEAGTQAQENHKDLHANSYTVLDGKLALEAVGDRVIVLEDKFKTGFECKTCGGGGYSNEPCPCCKGTGFEGEESLVPNCRVCCNPKIEQKQPGKKPCDDCRGKGGILVAPQTAKRRPTTGKIVSTGPGRYDSQGNWLPMIFKVGEHVMYSNYSGHAITYKSQDITIRVMRQDEIMTKMYAVESLTADELGVVDIEGQ